MDKVSPLAPESFPDMPPLAGVRLAAAACGIRSGDRDDLMLAELAPETTVAGVFTRSATAAAPVDWCRKALAGGTARALVVNAGNANAFTGAAGRDAVRRTAEIAASLVGGAPEGVFIASTGVIGEALSAGKILDALAGLHGKLRDDGWEEAPRAIMT
ncbi:MAG: bifunctional ornithine acetyltransferase/N-acetylglutamate synthase, partial [Proteobacteria bacterium]|nr:bifunctional ornithine acetyltransferase/N-acetylglutamate synthase [Pseudomonadota bacterium]